MGGEIHALSLSAGKFFNWLDILFPDFPRDQIRAAGEITSRIQLTLKYLSLIWENTGRGGKKLLLAACFPGALCLIALLLTKCWCNYEKETIFLFLLMRVTLVSSWTEVMKSQNTLILPLLLSFQTHLPSHRLWRSAFCAPHVTLHHPPSCDIVRKEQWGLLNLCVCAGEFEMPWLFVYFSIEGAV